MSKTPEREAGSAYKNDLETAKKKAQLRRAVTKGEIAVKIKSRNYSLYLTPEKIGNLPKMKSENFSKSKSIMSLNKPNKLGGTQLFDIL